MKPTPIAYHCRSGTGTASESESSRADTAKMLRRLRNTRGGLLEGPPEYDPFGRTVTVRFVDGDFLVYQLSPMPRQSGA